MNNWKVIFATVVIFGAGVLTGGLLVNYVQHSNYKLKHKTEAKTEPCPITNSVATNAVIHPAETNKPPRLPEVLSKQFLQNLDEGLHLTKEQREAVQKIIAEGQNQMRKTIQDARLEIREELTPEQQKQFDELMKRPVHKPIVGGTNAAAASLGTESGFNKRLKKLLEDQRTNSDRIPRLFSPESPRGIPLPPSRYPQAPALLPGSNLTPEEQVLQIEAQRAEFRAKVPPGSVLLPTNSP
jgi:uncharacterized membrane protein